MYNQPPQPKKRPLPAWAIIGICCLLLAAYAGIATLLKSGTNASPSTSSPDTSTSASSTWTTTHTFSGNGTKQTEIFTVPNDWQIQWRCNGYDRVDGVLVVYIYDSQAKLVDVAVNSHCKAGGQSTGSTEEHRSGSIYLKMGATGDWSVDIQEMQ